MSICVLFSVHNPKGTKKNKIIYYLPTHTFLGRVTKGETNNF